MKLTKINAVQRRGVQLNQAVVKAINETDEDQRLASQHDDDVPLYPPNTRVMLTAGKHLADGPVITMPLR